MASQRALAPPIWWWTAMQLTRELIERRQVDVEDNTVADLLAMGASGGQLAQAQASIANEEARLNAGTDVPSGRVARLVEL
jgi:hypothetical protein